MKMETELSPEFAVQTLPLASTATPAGELSEPKPALGETGTPPENSDNDPWFANQELPLPSKDAAVGSVRPPPENGLPVITVPVVVAMVKAPATLEPVVEPASETVPSELTATAVGAKSVPSLTQL
jgi:hypothetical protein